MISSLSFNDVGMISLWKYERSGQNTSNLVHQYSPYYRWLRVQSTGPRSLLSPNGWADWKTYLILRPWCGNLWDRQGLEVVTYANLVAFVYSSGEHECEAVNGGSPNRRPFSALKELCGERAHRRVGRLSFLIKVRSATLRIPMLDKRIESFFLLSQTIVSAYANYYIRSECARWSCLLTIYHCWFQLKYILCGYFQSEWRYLEHLIENINLYFVKASSITRNISISKNYAWL